MLEEKAKKAGFKLGSFIGSLFVSTASVCLIALMIAMTVKIIMRIF